MPTRNVVQTSVLSRRWRYLWTSVTVLDLDVRSSYCILENRYGRGRRVVEKKRKRKFEEFVDKVLHFHHVSTLQKFRLSCICADSLYPVEDWVRIAVTRGVRELDLPIWINKLVRLPSHLFVSQSLVHLKLCLYFSELKLPGAIALPALQSMCLRSVIFIDDDLTWKLFSGCSVLRSLTLFMCHYDRLRRLEISTPVLQDLTIDGSLDDDGGDDVKIIDCEVKISAPLLKSFTYRAPLAQDYDFEFFSSLVEVEVYFQNFELIPDQHPLDVVHEFLDRLSGTRKLKICEACVEALSIIPTSLNRAMVPFYHVNSLAMVSGHQGYTVLCRILRFLSSSHPHLKTLNVEFLDDPLLSTNPGDKLSKVSQTYAGVLEEVYIKCYEFITDELLELVEIILRTQPRLRRMQLVEVSSDSGGTYLELLRQKVQSFLRSSKSLVLSFT